MPFQLLPLIAAFTAQSAAPCVSFHLPTSYSHSVMLYLVERDVILENFAPSRWCRSVHSDTVISA